MEKMQLTTITQKDLNWEFNVLRDKFYREQDRVIKFIAEVKRTDNYLDKYLPMRIFNILIEILQNTLGYREL